MITVTRHKQETVGLGELIDLLRVDERSQVRQDLGNGQVTVDGKDWNELLRLAEIGLMWSA